MKTLGIVFLVLLAIFFGGCAVTAVVFSSLDSSLWVVALVAAGLCVACIAGIRSLNRSDETGYIPPEGEPERVDTKQLDLTPSDPDRADQHGVDKDKDN